MIEKAINRILELKDVEIKEIREDLFSTKKLYPVPPVDYEPAPETLEVHTLTGLIDYINGDLDNAGDYIVHVKSHNEVELYGELEPAFGRRKKYVRAVFDGTRFRFGDFYSSENFIINLQSEFTERGDRALVMQKAGTTVGEDTTAIDDDGVSQNIVVRQGIQKKATEELPNPVRLAPYRTFPEIEQVESNFVFRVNADGSRIHFALFESDGGRWKLDSIHAIKNYLSEMLKNKAIIIA